MVLRIMLFLLYASTILTESPEERILGGFHATKDKREFHVSLFNKNKFHYCGGAIIRPTWIATAAHCNGVCQEGLYCAVRYGSLNIRRGRLAPIRIFVTHPKYSDDIIPNYDVALAESPMLLDGSIKPIPIVFYDVPFREYMFVTGWGWTTDKSHSCSQFLKQTGLRRSPCPLTLTDTFICALAANTNPCHGDSGGPLTYRGMLVGVTAFGARIPDISETTGFVSRSYIISHGKMLRKKNNFHSSVVESKESRRKRYAVTESVEDDETSSPRFQPVYFRTYASNNQDTFDKYGTNRNSTPSLKSWRMDSMDGTGSIVLDKSTLSLEPLQRRKPFETRCFPGVVANFAYLYRFRDWINSTIAEYSDLYDLDNLPLESEWTHNYLEKLYNFTRDTRVC